eukprot:gene7247-12931_t
MIGQSKEELVIEEPVKFGQSSGKVKFLVAIAVVLAVLAVLFIGLYATERKNLKNLEEETASVKQKGGTMTTKSPVTRNPVTRNPVTTNPVTKAPEPDLRPSTIQVAASNGCTFCNANSSPDFYGIVVIIRKGRTKLDEFIDLSTGSLLTEI